MDTGRKMKDSLQPDPTISLLRNKQLQFGPSYSTLRIRQKKSISYYNKYMNKEAVYWSETSLASHYRVDDVATYSWETHQRSYN